MLPFLSITGISVFFIILYFSARKYPSFIYLGLFFFLISLYAFYQFVLIYSKSVFLVSLFLFNIAIICSPLYLIGPMLFWYIRSALSDNAKLKRRDIWHLLPLTIFFIAALPHAFVPWHEKVEAARAIVEDAGFMEVYRATLLARIFTPSFEYLTRPILVLGYTLWSTGLFMNYLIKKKSTVVLSKQHFMKKWLFFFLGLLLMLGVTHIFLIIKAFELHFSELFFTFNVVRILSGAGLIGLLISPFFFPEILYGLPRLPEQNSTLESVVGKSDLPQEEEKKPTWNLEADYLLSISFKTDSCMGELQPYLQPDFNLPHLSMLIDIPIHHLAYYFREVKKMSFNDYRNEWRINHSKNLIRKGTANKITLEAIGKMSGFSNRNSFRIMFEKVEGITPHVYALQKCDKIEADSSV
jgi:AraC-like DNA-binding protein